jgi:peptidoglycan/LPS O-acetylase OafA/YrhL
MGRIAHIDGLRAIAVIAVLAYHLRSPGFTGGFVGVDVFFVISGFVITRMILRDIDAGRFGFVAFYAGRIRRLVPALLATVAIAGIVAALTLTPWHLQEFARSAAATLTARSNVVFAQQAGYFDLDSRLKPLLHTWTLSVEWQFYAVWPAVIAGVAALRRQLLPAAIAVLGAASLAANLAWHGDPSTLFYQMPFRIFEFAIGALVLWMPPLRHRGLAGAAVTLGLGLIAAAVVRYDVGTRFPGDNALPPVVGAALVIYAGGATAVGRLLDNRVATYIGRISYSTYLVHWPLIVFWAYVAFRPLTTGEAVVIGLLSIALGAAMAHVVEVPFWKGRLQGAVPAWRIVGAVAAALILAASSAAQTGWPWRIPAESMLLAQNPLQFHLDHYGGASFPVDTVFTLGEGEPGFIVAGDSHALQFAYGLDTVLRRRHAAALGLFRHGCFIAPEVTRFGVGPAEQALCEQAYPKLLAAMRGNQLPLMLAFNWSAYAGLVGPPGGAPIAFGDPDAYRAYLFARLDAIRRDAGSRRIVLVGSVPGSAFAAADCLLRPAWASRRCWSRIDTAADRTAGYAFNRSLAAYAAARGAAFVDPYVAFCPDGICRAVQDGRLLYSDAGHLSKDGSLFAVSRLGLAEIDAAPAGARR